MLAIHPAADPSLAVNIHAKATAPFVRDSRMARNALCIVTILVEGVSVVDIFARKTVPQVKECARGTVPSNVRSYAITVHVVFPVQTRARLVQKRARGRVHTFVASSPALL